MGCSAGSPRSPMRTSPLVLVPFHFSHSVLCSFQASRRFLSSYFAPLAALRSDDLKNKKGLEGHCVENQVRALDCGAGIGRVTKHLLLDFFQEVDLLEINEKFLAKARDYIGHELYDERVGRTFCCSLHQFRPPESRKYDLIWTQWVTGHLTDDHYVEFLKKCQSLLNKPHGLLIIKDNHTSSDEADADTLDSSVTRPYWLLIDIFKKAGMTLVAERRQYKFPKGLYPVKMFALR